MRFKSLVLCVGLLGVVGACKKSGGGGGWLVGSDGLMQNVQTNGHAAGYNLGSSETLNGIACRYAGEAWVVGTNGTLLYTNDGGASWQRQAVPTTADLRALATQDSGPVFIAGNGVFLTTRDTGAHWTALGDGTANFRSVAAAQDGSTVLAVADDGGVWSYENAQLVKRTSVAGARAVAVSPDGQTAMLAGAGLWQSIDAGRTWSALAGGDGVRYDDARLDASGQAVAVGTGGAVAHIASDGQVVMQQIGTADLHTIHIAEIGEASESIGFTAGDGGQVWMTGDGGATWSQGPNLGRTVFGVDEIGGGHR